jgi:hypothetical protein
MKTRTPGSPGARAMVRKEIWGHLLLYNLIRGVMAEAAGRHGLLPRESSLKGARQTVAGFRADRETYGCSASTARSPPSSPDRRRLTGVATT